jgi:hypothetical protein
MNISQPKASHWARSLRPLAYVFSFPKWCRDEFLSRSTWDASYLRRWILRRLPVLDKPPFDASLRFNKYDVPWSLLKFSYLFHGKMMKNVVDPNGPKDLRWHMTGDLKTDGSMCA